LPRASVPFLAEAHRLTEAFEARQELIGFSDLKTRVL
jgi:hypothetical protein